MHLLPFGPVNTKFGTPLRAIERRSCCANSSGVGGSTLGIQIAGAREQVEDVLEGRAWCRVWLSLNSRAGATINDAARKHFTWSVISSFGSAVGVMATLIQAVWPRV